MAAVTLARLQKNVKTKALQHFAELLVADTPTDELTIMGEEHALGAIKLAYDAVKSYAAKKTKTPSIEVTNPAFTKHSVACIIMPDMPFIVDTVWMTLKREGKGIHHSFHPILDVGAKSITAADAKTQQATSCIWVEFDRCQTSAEMKTTKQDLTKALKLLQAATTDFPKMSGQLAAVAENLPAQVRPESRAFLEWAADNHFVFLGYRHYDYKNTKDGAQVKVTPKSGLGILRDDKSSAVATSTKVKATGTSLQHYVDDDRVVILSKTPNKSLLHRDAYMDYIGVKVFNKNGKICGEHRFLGLYTSRAYTANARTIPLVAEKIENVLKRYHNAAANSYNLRVLLNILETFPRDELFLTAEEDLYRIATGVLHLMARQHVRVFVRKSETEQAITAFIYLPLQRMNSQLRLKIEAILMRAYNGTAADFRVHMEDASTHARIIYKIKTPEPLAKVDDAKVETEVIAATRGWLDEVRHALIETCGDEDGLNLYTDYAEKLPLAYQEITPPIIAVDDIETMAIMAECDDKFQVRLHVNGTDARLRLFRQDVPIELSDVMPLLDNLGLHVTTQNSLEVPSCSQCEQSIWIQDFTLDNKDKILTENKISNICHVVTALWQGKVENDVLNQLAISAELTATEINIVRALCAYAQQVGAKYNTGQTHGTLTRYPAIARDLVCYFVARHTPDMLSQQGTYIKSIEKHLQNVPGIEDDNTVRLLQSIVAASLRSNVNSKNEAAPLAIKLDSSKITELPKPTPYREIFVYHPTFEGVHLRGGKIARGGLRHSDRASDYRTEVLGLMKAQNTKNTIIVPAGAKGGFFIKDTIQAGTRADYTAAVEGYYKQFIQSLLSITDNTIKGKTVHPTDVVIHDEADPYFVVAADKGTATFSDTANAEAAQARFWVKGNQHQDVGFWLDDAFASGGSQGYDHKKMGITARGAWESVKHHGKQFGLDTQNQDFTVVGIGDMGGDVFGNGMLLSKHIRLVAAFNHKHIFVDPDPDAKTSFAERERLFKIGGGWDKYNQKFLSKGGAIFERSQKSIKISPQIQKRLELDKVTVTPTELMRAILGARVDLLWNGGIGTYIKASDESQQDAADKGNDAIRLNGAEFRCKMVGEGGNLGATQAGRIEYALKGNDGAGGYINTDALDNSAGVDSSDHEVNIKILLGSVVARDEMTLRQRNNLLSKMTSTVAEHVLRNNSLQNEAITFKIKQGVGATDTNYDLQESLVQSGLLDAEEEGLPTRDGLQQRRQLQGQGYTRPELAVLLAYAKMDITQEILASDLCKSQALHAYAQRYFPAQLKPKYATAIAKHQLQREIIATVLANEIVNRMGMTFVNRLRTETGQTTADILSAYLIAAHLYGAQQLWSELEAQQDNLEFELYFELLSDIKKRVEAGTYWLLRQVQSFNFGSMVNKYSDVYAQIIQQMPEHLSAAEQHNYQTKLEILCTAGLDEKLAYALAKLPHLDGVADVAHLVVQYKYDVSAALSLYAKVGENLNLHRVSDYIEQLPVENQWQRLAQQSLSTELHLVQRALTRGALAVPPARGSDQWSVYCGKITTKRANYLALLDDIDALDEALTHAHLQTLMSQLQGLVH